MLRTAIQTTIIVGLCVSAVPLTAAASAGADLNADGIVNFLDLALMRQCFKEVPSDNRDCLSADLNGDDLINFADLWFLRDGFLNVVPPEQNLQLQYPGVQLPVTDRPFELATADLNGDGALDLVTTGFFDGYVGVVLGNGDSTFRPTRYFDTGSGPVSLAIADIDGDDRPDLVTANFESADIRVLIGNGDGTFQGAIVSPSSESPYSVVVGDLNADGIPDIVTHDLTNEDRAEDVHVQLGNGDGTFAAPVAFPTGNLFASNPILADMNNDGRLDVIVGADDETLVVMPGDGAGGFEAGLEFARQYNSYQLLADDFNNDGALDIASIGLNSVEVLLGDGDGSVQPSISFGTGGQSIAAGDFNDDGNPDIVTASRDVGQGLRVYTGAGDGTFVFVRRYRVGLDALSVVVGDIDGNGLPDIFSSDLWTDSVTVLTNTGDGSFATALELETGGDFAGSMLAGDVNGDDTPDLLTTAANIMWVTLGNGDGTFQQPQGYPTGLFPDDLDIGDLTHDGFPDVVTANTSDNVSLLIGNGDGSFQAALALKAPPAKAVIVFDIDTDGRQDLVALNRFTDEITVVLGSGGSYTVPAGTSPQAFVVGDLNDDGMPDMAITQFFDEVLVLTRTGSGSWAPQVFAVGIDAEDIAIGDLNGDTVPDIVTVDGCGPNVCRAPGHVSVLLGTGGADYAPARSFAVGREPGAIAIADLNDDGAPDLVTANRYYDISILYGNGDGTFMPYHSVVGSGDNFLKIVIDDFTGDGKPDLVTGTSPVLLVPHR